MPRSQWFCIHCAAPYWGNHVRQRRCNPCRDLVAPIIANAQRMARREAEHGRLTDLRGDHDVKCVDCGGVARQWDHRDYGKPLDVVPVCKRCNLRRGPGLVPGAKGNLDRYFIPGPPYVFSHCRVCREAGRKPTSEALFKYCDDCRKERGLRPVQDLRATMAQRSMQRYGYTRIHA